METAQSDQGTSPTTDDVPDAKVHPLISHIVGHTPWWNTQQRCRLSNMDIREIFAINLRKARHAKGLSQEALAADAEIDRTYVSVLERGIYSATIDMVAKLAVILDVEPADLLARPAGFRPRPRSRERSRG